MKLYQVEVTGRIGGDGLSTWELVGDSVTVDGVPMVRLSYGTITLLKNFVPSRADALRIAADKVDEMRLRLVEQSARLRAEADALTAKAATEATT